MVVNRTVIKSVGEGIRAAPAVQMTAEETNLVVTTAQHLGNPAEVGEQGKTAAPSCPKRKEWGTSPHSAQGAQGTGSLGTPPVVVERTASHPVSATRSPGGRQRVGLELAVLAVRVRLA